MSTLYPGLSLTVALLCGSAIGYGGAVAQDAASAEAAPVSQEAPAGIPAAEARLYSGGGGFVFANGRDARNIPFELNSDKIYVQVRLNDQGPFWMMLDTGSPGMVLDTATAARLGLPLGKSGETTGAGEATFTLTEVTSTVDAGMPGVTLKSSQPPSARSIKSSALSRGGTWRVCWAATTS